jgi:hypothetical protein
VTFQHPFQLSSNIPSNCLPTSLPTVFQYPFQRIPTAYCHTHPHTPCECEGVRTPRSGSRSRPAHPCSHDNRPVFGSSQRPASTNDVTRGSWIRRGLDQGVCPPARSMGEHSAETKWQRPDLLQPVSVSCAELDRTVLQQDQAMSARRNPVRQTRSQLSGVHQARINPNLATR